MGIFDRIAEKAHEREKDRRIERVKKLIERGSYAEAKEILSEGIDDETPCEFEMWSAYRRNDVEKLYNLCDQEERASALQKRVLEREKQREEKRQKRAQERQELRNQLKESKPLTNDDMDNAIWRIELDISTGKWESALRMLDWAEGKFEHVYRYDEFSKLRSKYNELYGKGKAEQRSSYENKISDESEIIQTVNASEIKKTSPSRFERELANFNITTVGYRNSDCPSMGIVMANTIKSVLGTGKRCSLKNEDNTESKTFSGLSLSSICVEYETENRHYTHRDYLNVSESAQGLIYDNFDGAILIINALDGITSDIREQVQLAKMAGAFYWAVFVDNCDLIQNKNQLEQMGEEICEFFYELGYDGDMIPVIFGSAKGALQDPVGEWGESVISLIDNIDDYMPNADGDKYSPFLMPVEDVFSVTNRGIVATGRVETGVVKVSDKVEIVGLGTQNKTVVVTGIEMFRKLMDSAEPGDNVGLLLRGVDRTEIKRGHVLAKVGTQKAADKFKAVVCFFDAKTLEQMADRVEMDIRMRTVLLRGAICVSKDSVNSNGQYAQATVELPESIAMNKGMFFAIENVGIGRIIEVLNKE